MTDEARAGEPRTGAGQALLRLGPEWAIRGTRTSRAIELAQGWTDGTYQTNEELFRRIVLAIEREAAPSLDVERLTEAINNVAKANPPIPGLPVSRTIPEAAAAYAAEYARLSESAPPVAPLGEE